MGGCRVALGQRCRWFEKAVLPVADQAGHVHQQAAREARDAYNLQHGLSEEVTIRLSYRTAKEKYELPGCYFTRGIDDCVEVGLVDIEHQGGGLFGDASVYTLSERWRLWHPNAETRKAKRSVERRRERDNRRIGYRGGEKGRAVIQKKRGRKEI